MDLSKQFTQEPTPEPYGTKSRSGDAKHLLTFSPDPVKLATVASINRNNFKNSQPFSHVVLDDLFPAAILQKVIEEAPSRNAQNWTQWGSGSDVPDPALGIKMGISSELSVGPHTRDFMLQLNSNIFIQFLEILTNTKRLVGDPSFQGGGLHSTGSGGRLRVHADADRHPYGKPFHQTINMIIFLNRDWHASYGGNLELWARDGSVCMQQISPVFNRCVIFESGTNTYHGHPKPLACPVGRQRLSLASYYYKVDRQFDENYKGFSARVNWLQS